MRNVGWVPGRRRIGLICLLGVWSCLAPSTFAGPNVRLSESGDAVELEFPGDAKSYRETIPLYRSGEIRYFSAGVGIEERSANYPPFALKLVFTAGGKPYLAGVSVTIQQGTKTLAAIPREHVTGPWLFIDTPEGSYHIAATMEGQTEHLKDIKVERGKSRTLYLRWTEDRGRSRDAKIE